jgi:hypothetical protein
MNTDQKRPMSEDQLEYVKNEIKKTYLYLIGHTTYDPEVIEVMKLALRFLYFTLLLEPLYLRRLASF